MPISTGTISDQPVSAATPQVTSAVKAPSDTFTRVLDAVQYGALGLPVGFADTTGHSLGLWDDNAVADTLKKMSPTGFGDWYAREKEGVKIGADIVGVFIPGMAGLKVLNWTRRLVEAGKFGEALKGSTALANILGQSETLANSERAIANAAQKSQDAFGVWSGRSFANPAVAAAKRTYYGQRVIEVARQTAVIEAATHLTFNASDTIYPADATVGDELRWAGLGFAGSAAIDYAFGRYAVRGLLKAANRVNSYGGSELGEKSSELLSRPGDRGPIATYQAYTLNLAASAIKESGDATLKTNAQQDLIVAENVLRKTIAEMGNDTHAVLPRLSLDPKDARVNLVVSALSKDQTALLFATKIADLPADKAEFYGALNKNVENARLELNDTLGKMKVNRKANDPLTQQLTERAERDAYDKFRVVDDTHRELHVVVENTGELSTYQTRAANWLDNHGFDDVKKSTFKVSELQADGKAKKDIPHAMLEVDGTTLDDRFVVGGANPKSAKQWSTLYAMGSRMIANFRPAEGQQFILNEKVPWQQMDGILNLIQAKPEMRALVVFDGKIKNLKDAEFHVVNEKYKSFIEDMKVTERVSEKTPKFARRGVLQPNEVIMKHNLPTGGAGLQPHPLLQVFAHAKAEGAEDLAQIFNKTGNQINRDHPLDLLQAAMRDAAEVKDPSIKYDIAGKMWQQTDVRPVLVAMKSIPSMPISEARLAAMIESQNEIALSRLGDVDPAVAPMVANSVQGFGGLAAMPVAKDVRSLAEGVLSGRGIVTGQDRIAEQIPALKALSLIAQEHDKAILNTIKVQFAENLHPLMTELQKRGNYAHLLDYNRVEQSYRHGWDIAGIAYDQDGKTARFVLDATNPTNRLLAEKYFSKDTAAAMFKEKTIFMPDMSVTAANAMRRDPVPLRVSTLAADTAQEISRLSIQSGREVNALRVAMGRPAISLRDFHLPTPELANERAWFVKNARGEVVATFSKQSEAQNRRRAEEAAGELKKRYGEDHSALGAQDVQREHMFDDNFQGFTDYSDQLAKTGSPITGGGASTTIDTTANTLKDTVRTLSRQFLNVGIRTRAAIFEPQINYAKIAARQLPEQQMKEFNVYQRYLATMFSRSTLSPKGTVGGVYSWAEEKLDAGLSYLYSVKAETLAATPEGKAAARKVRSIIRAESSEQQYKNYQKTADWSPFHSTEAWLESTHPEISTLPLKAYGAKLGQISSTLALRFLDAGTWVMNYAGFYTTAPAVLAAMRRGANENDAEYISRVGAYGSNISRLPGVMPFSPMKALIRAQHAFWSGELNEPLARAAQMGMFEPEYAQLAHALSGGITSTSGSKGVERFMYWANRAADSSEITSRKMAWALGYKIGQELHQFDDEKNLFIFANNMVNEIIGNYSPRNKPGIFQGAIGQPLGAFQTYMFNYYRRMYGYLERKDFRALASAYGAQASFFGAQSVPGWGAFNSALFSNYDGSDDLVHRLDRKLPPGVSELLLHGSVSSIPSIFGRGDLDIAFYPRGSVDITQIPANPLDYSRAPPIQFLAETAEGIGKTLNNVMSGFSIQRQEEIMANFTTNRAIKNIMEFAAGAKTDRAGQYVADATLDAVHIAAAMAGTVPSSTRSIQDAYNSQQLVERHQEALRDDLNQRTRSLFRGNEVSLSAMQDMVHDYMRSGGNPAYFGQWLRNTVESSFIPKVDKKLVELGKSGKWNEFMNMLAAMQRGENRNETE